MSIKRSSSFTKDTDNGIITINSSEEELLNYCSEKGLITISRDDSGYVSSIRTNISRDEIKSKFIEFLSEQYPDLASKVGKGKLEVSEKLYDSISTSFRKYVFDTYPFPKSLFTDMLNHMVTIEKYYAKSKVGNFEKESLREWGTIITNARLGIKLNDDLSLSITAFIKDLSMLGEPNSDGHRVGTKGKLKGFTLAGEGYGFEFVGLTIEQVSDELRYIKEFDIYAKITKLGGKLPKLELINSDEVK